MYTGIFATAMKEWFGAGPLIEMDTQDIGVRILDVRRSFPGCGTTVEVAALVFLHASEIRFQETESLIREAVREKAGDKKIRVVCDWFVCSERGGIYLFEALASRENIQSSKMKNRFAVFNSYSGTVSFGPGHIRNTGASEKLTTLLERHTSTPPVIWNAEMHALFTSCLDVTRKKSMASGFSMPTEER